MSVKLSIVSYLSNFVVNVSRNCWEKTLNLADIKKLSDGTFRIITITVTKIVLMQVFPFHRWF